MLLVLILLILIVIVDRLTNRRLAVYGIWQGVQLVIVRLLVLGLFFGLFGDNQCESIIVHNAIHCRVCWLWVGDYDAMIRLYSK
jgi:hypothetical protein